MTAKLNDADTNPPGDHGGLEKEIEIERLATLFDVVDAGLEDDGEQPPSPVGKLTSSLGEVKIILSIKCLLMTEIQSMVNSHV